MKVTLDTDEICKAISSYMALKGYMVKDGYMDFQWDGYARGDNVSVTFGIKPIKVDLEKIKKYANG